MFRNFSTAFARANSHKFIQITALLIATATIAALPAVCHAQGDFQWTNTTSLGAFYDLSSNWSTGGPPSSIDVAQFNQAAAYQVVWDTFTQSATPSVGEMEVLDGEVTFLNQEFFPIGFTVNQDLLVNGAATQLTNFGLDLSVNGNTTVSGGASLVIDGAHPTGASLLSGSTLVSGSTLTLKNGATGDLGTLSVNGLVNVNAGSSLVSSSAILGQSSSFGQVRISGPDATWENAGILVIGLNSGGQLNVEAGGVVTTAGGRIGLLNPSEAQVSGGGSRWNMNGDLTLGENSSAFLNINGGGVVSNVNGVVGEGGFEASSVSIADSDSQWNNSGQLTVGLNSFGMLDISNGGLVTSDSGRVGFSADAQVFIRGADSRWDNNGDLVVGVEGESVTVNIDSGWSALQPDATIAATSDVLAVSVTVTGAGSQWNNSGNLAVSTGGNATLDIENGGLVTVGGTTSIGAGGNVNLMGGRFEFGETSLAEFSRINAVTGSLSGNVNHSQFTDVAALTSLQNQAVDLTEVTLANSGTLFGSASLSSSLRNNGNGEVETANGERLRFAGAGNLNQGEINLLGGEVRFDQDFTNAESGFVGGHGTLIANGGLLNRGVMAFGSSSNVLGDVTNDASGQIVTTGGGTTIFFDDVLHNGAEIRTSAGSNTVILGDASGAGAYTGAGSVFFEGDLRPGNSPGIVDFEGSVVFGNSLLSEFQLGGIQLGQYDRLNIDGNLFLDGELTVSLIDDFHLGLNQEFLIADVGGQLFGSFDGLVEGSLVGNFGGRDLFISYAAGNGRSISLFTAIPEPGALGILTLASSASLFCRRRRNLV